MNSEMQRAEDATFIHLHSVVNDLSQFSDAAKIGRFKCLRGQESYGQLAKKLHQIVRHVDIKVEESADKYYLKAELEEIVHVLQGLSEHDRGDKDFLTSLTKKANRAQENVEQLLEQKYSSRMALFDVDRSEDAEFEVDRESKSKVIKSPKKLNKSGGEPASHSSSSGSRAVDASPLPEKRRVVPMERLSPFSHRDISSPDRKNVANYNSSIKPTIRTVKNQMPQSMNQPESLNTRRTTAAIVSPRRDRSPAITSSDVSQVNNKKTAKPVKSTSGSVKKVAPKRKLSDPALRSPGGVDMTPRLQKRRPVPKDRLSPSL